MGCGGGCELFLETTSSHFLVTAHVRSFLWQMVGSVLAHVSPMSLIPLGATLLSADEYLLVRHLVLSCWLLYSL